MFRCRHDNSVSDLREVGVVVVAERPIVHPRRYKKYIDEDGREQRVLEDKGGEGFTISSLVRVRASNLEAFLAEHPEWRVLP